MNLYHRLRLAAGLRWENDKPRAQDLGIGLQSILVALFLVGIYGIVGEMDYRDALRAEAEAQQTRAELNRADFLACLNGQATGHYTENTRGERTYIVCRGVEEIPVGKAS